jgi:hypothetical protein
MVTGKDLELPSCRVFCRAAIVSGHEIANHTFSHSLVFDKLSFKKKEDEIVRTGSAIKKACGKYPVGFRSPGYYLDEELISILCRHGYQYDSSILPGFAQLFMKTYANMKGGKNRGKTFGRSRDILSKTQPYMINDIKSNLSLLEMPISVLPLIKFPIHTTFAYFFGSCYRRFIMNFLRSKPKYLLYLFHAIDFIDLGNSYSNHPVIALRHSFSERMNFAQEILGALSKSNKKPIMTARSSLPL